MTIALDKNWTSTQSSGAVTTIATGSTSPVASSTMSGGYVVGSSNLTSIVDSVLGSIPGTQILTLGQCGGLLNSTVYWFWNPISGTSARSFTANFGASAPAMINVQTWTGLPSSNFIDYTPAVNTGTSTTASFATGSTVAANELAIALWLPTGSPAITYSGQTITVCGTTGFNGLGNSTSGGGSAVTYNNGYLIGTGVAGTCSGSQGIGTSQTWAGFVVTLSPTQIVSSTPNPWIYHRRNVLYNI